MLHMAANYASVANGTALLQVAGIQDVVLQVRDSAIIVPSKPKPLIKLVTAIAYSAHLTRAQLQPPFLRVYGNYEMKPVANAFSAGGARTPTVDLSEEAFNLEVGEELPVYAVHSNASAEGVIIGLLLADKQPERHRGEIFTIRLTGATTLTANAWTQCPLTFDQGLPKGEYRCVGARVEGVSPVLFRFIHSNDISRPGGVAHQSALSLDIPGQRAGGRGVWFEFDYLTPPTLEVFATAADTAQTVLLDVAKI